MSRIILMPLFTILLSLCIRIFTRKSSEPSIGGRDIIKATALFLLSVIIGYLIEAV